MTTARDLSPGQRAQAARPPARERLFDRYPWTVFAAFACLCLYSVINGARVKPFWHDEIYTILHAGLPSLGSMWAAAIDGFDLSPPLNTWVTRAVHSVAGVGHITTRIPPIAGYLAMTTVVFQLLRTRANTATALAGAVLPVFTAAYRYSYEARAYGLMLGLFALSLFAWSEAARGRRRPFHLSLLAVTLPAAVWNHYYGILTVVPIAGGEVVRFIQRRKIDAGVLAAFTAAALALLPLYPLAAAARGQSQSFWSPVTLSNVGDVYVFLFAAFTAKPLTDVAIVLVVLLLLARRRRAADEFRRTLPAHEVAAGLLSVLIPVMGVLLGLALTGVFVPRYAMPAVVGVSLLIPLTVWWGDTRGGIAELFLSAFLAGTFLVSIWPSFVTRPAFRDPFLSRPLLREAVATGSPVVSSSSLQFLQYWYYTPHAQKGRLRYLADVDEAWKHMQSDTIDRGYLALRRWTAVPIDRYEDYVAGHREFRVHEAGSGWLLRELDEIGATKEEIGQAPGERLFVVRLR